MAHQARNSSNGSQQVACPHCGDVQTVETVTVLRPGAAVQKLMEGSLNRVTCEACETPFLVESPLLFRNDPHRFLAYYLPVEGRDGRVDAEREMQRVTERIFGPDDEDAKPTCRLTVDRRGFVEKIAISLNDLDDRLVEYVKYQLYSREGNGIDPIRSQLFYDFSSTSEANLCFILFDRETGQAQAAALIPMELYDELREAFLGSENLRGELESLFPGCIVSAADLLT